jgi:hypothetical protein
MPRHRPREEELLDAVETDLEPAYLPTSTFAPFLTSRHPHAVVGTLPGTATTFAVIGFSFAVSGTQSTTPVAFFDSKAIPIVPRSYFVCLL